MYRKCNPIVTETYYTGVQNPRGYCIDKATIGGKIKYYRHLKGLKQTDLASLSHVDCCTVKKYENNTVNPSLNILNKFAIALAVDIKLLLDDYFFFLLSYDTTIKNFRKDLHLSQRELASLLYVNRKTVIRWESKVCQPCRAHYNKILAIIKQSFNLIAKLN